MRSVTPTESITGCRAVGPFAHSALLHHRLGRNVVPICRGASAKNPPRGYRLRESFLHRQSEAEVRDLIRRYGAFDIAIVTGPVSNGFVAVDVDTQDGLMWLESRVDRSMLNGTAASRTSRGIHFYFRFGEPIKAGRVVLNPGVELLAGRHFCIVPPSRGRMWAGDHCRLAPLPPQIVELMHVRKEDKMSVPSMFNTETSILSSNLASNLRTSNLRGLMTSPNVVGPDGDSHMYGAPSAERRSMNLNSAFADEGIVRRLLHLIGIDPAVPVGAPFSCVLPGHDELHPSAALSRDKSDRYVYVDFHRRDGDLVFPLPVVFAAQKTGKVVRLRGPRLALWGHRLLCEAGIILPVEVPLLPCPDEHAAIVAVYNGIRQVFGLRWFYEPATPAPITASFMADWVGISEFEAKAALLRLRAAGVLVKSGRHRLMNLYLPGS